MKSKLLLITKKILFLSILSVSISSFSSDTIQTGRPGQSIGAGVVGESVFQIQSGFENSNLKVVDSETESTLMNNILRYGLNKKLETSMVLDVSKSNSTNAQTGNFQVGGRMALIEKGKGFTPKLCFQTRFQIVDTNGEQNKSFKAVSILSGVFDLNRFGAITSNLLFNNIGEENYDFKGYTLSWSRNYNEKLSYFFEHYSNKSDEEWLGFWDTGVGYLIHNDLALDFSFGTDLNQDIDSKFISIGFSWRKRLI